MPSLLSRSRFPQLEPCCLLASQALHPLLNSRHRFGAYPAAGPDIRNVPGLGVHVAADWGLRVAGYNGIQIVAVLEVCVARDEMIDAFELDVGVPVGIDVRVPVRLEVHVPLDLGICGPLDLEVHVPLDLDVRLADRFADRSADWLVAWLADRLSGRLAERLLQGFVCDAEKHYQ